MFPRLSLLTAVLVLSVFGVAATAMAQPDLISGISAERRPDTGVALPERLTRDAARDLMSRISDEDARTLLLEQLDRQAATGDQRAESGLLATIDANGAIIRSRLEEVLGAAPAAPSAIALIGERLSPEGGVGPALFALAVILAVGLTARLIWRKSIIGRRRARNSQKTLATPDRPFQYLMGIAGLMAIELSGVLVFVVAAGAVLLAVWSEGAALSLFLSTYLTAFAAALAAGAVADVLLSRQKSRERLLPLCDDVVSTANRFTIVLATIWLFGYGTAHLLEFYGAASAPLRFIRLCVGTLFIAVLIALFLSVRRGVAAAICGGVADTAGGATWRNALAENWHVFAILYCVLLWVLSIVEQQLSESPGGDGVSKGLIGLLALAAVPATDALIGRAIDSRFGEGNRLSCAIRRTLRVALVFGAATLLLRLWGISIDEIERIGIGGRLVGTAVDLGVIALIAYAAWELVRACVDSLLEHEAASDEAMPECSRADGEGGGASATRAATVLPLLRLLGFGVIVVMAVMIGLSQFGVDIGPLLAGAGVIGIAIGFGAQTLVRDVVSGMFFLIDDAFRMGEYIDVGSAKGTVEKISVRSFRLRHHLGPLHTVPFGEIQTLTNYSRDWVIMKLPLRLTYDTDPQRVKKIIRRIGEEMMANDELRAGLLEAPKSQGVLQMDDSAMILRVKFMSKPGEQFVLRRELLHRVRAAFAEAGIRFASREVTVHVEGEERREEGSRQAAAAAARTLLDEESAAQGQDASSKTETR